MVEYPPYVNAYGKISELFKRIKDAAVPTKFTNDFLYSKLELKSITHRAFIGLLKKLGFIDENQTPTSVYREYREEAKSRIVMAKAIKKAYSGLYEAKEYAHTMTKSDVISKLNSILGTSKDDPQVPKAASTFIELVKLADFDKKEPTEETEEQKTEEINKETTTPPFTSPHKFGISYTINLNLPATTDVEVFNAIFKALKENLLK